MERLDAPRELEVTLHRLSAVKLATTPFEGHVAVTATATPIRRRERYAAGSVRIPTAQPLGDLVAVLLEPGRPTPSSSGASSTRSCSPPNTSRPTSWSPWPSGCWPKTRPARPNTRRAYARTPTFAASPTDRLQWIYQRTPFYDARALLYPVGREE